MEAPLRLLVESSSSKTNQSPSRDGNLDEADRELRDTGRELPIMALDIAILALPFIGVRGTGKKIYSLFVGVSSSTVVRDTPDKIKGIELCYRFLGGMLFSQGPAIHTQPKTQRKQYK